MRYEGALSNPQVSELGRDKTEYGRLVFFAGHYDRATGRYSRPDLCIPFGRRQSDLLLQLGHETAFAAWLDLKLSQQIVQISASATIARLSPAALVDGGFYGTLIPRCATHAEIGLFRADMRASLGALCTAAGTSQAIAALPPQLDWRLVLLSGRAKDLFADPALTLRTIATAFRTPPERLGRLFRRSMQLNFGCYLRLVRLFHAVRALRKPLFSIKEVAFRVGYSDAGNFVRDFAAVQGIPPGAFRRDNMLRQMQT